MARRGRPRKGDKKGSGNSQEKQVHESGSGQDLGNIGFSSEDLEILGAMVEMPSSVMAQNGSTGKEKGIPVGHGTRNGPQLMGAGSLPTGAAGNLGAGASSLAPVVWLSRADEAEKADQGVVPQAVSGKERKTRAEIVQGNRDTSLGWSLDYVKPSDPTGAVVITEEDWKAGSKQWDCAIVGYVLGLKPRFRDMAN